MPKGRNYHEQCVIYQYIYIYSCYKCTARTYSYEDPHSEEELKCNECPNNLVCMGGNVSWPLSGYWRNSPTTTFILECQNKKACL